MLIMASLLESPCLLVVTLMCCHSHAWRDPRRVNNDITVGISLFISSCSDVLSQSFMAGPSPC